MKDTTTVQGRSRGSVSSNYDSSSEEEDNNFTDDQLESKTDETVNELTEKFSEATLIPRKPTRVASERRESNTRQQRPYIRPVQYIVTPPAQRYVSQSGGTLIQNIQLEPNFYHTNIPTTQDIHQNIPTTQTIHQNIPTTQTLQQNIPTSQVINQNIPTSQNINQNIPTSHQIIPTTIEIHQNIPKTQQIHIPTTQSINQNITTTQVHLNIPISHQSVPKPQNILQNIPAVPEIHQNIPTTQVWHQNITKTDDKSKQDEIVESVLNELIDCNSNDAFFQTLLQGTTNLPELTNFDVEDYLNTDSSNDTNANNFTNITLFNTNNIQLPLTPDSIDFDDNNTNLSTFLTSDSANATNLNFSGNTISIFRESRESFSTTSTPSYIGCFEYSPCSSIDEQNRESSIEYNFIPNICDDNIPTTVNDAPRAIYSTLRDSAKKILKAKVNTKPDIKTRSWVFMNTFKTAEDLIDCTRKILRTENLKNLDVLLYAAIEVFLKRATQEEKKKLFESEPSILEVVALKNEREVTMYIAEIMMNHNLKLNKIDYYGRTLLHKLIEESRQFENIITDLLSLKNDNNKPIFDVNEKDNDHMTAIHYAIRNHHDKLETLEILLRNGADMLTTIPGNDQTYLHYALENSKDVKIFEATITEAQTQEVVYRLTRRRDNSGETALEMACNKEDISISDKNTLIQLLMPFCNDLTNSNISPI